MNEHEVVQTVNAALAEEFELELSELTAEKHLRDDLGLDSLDAVDMVIVLEQAFSFKIQKAEAIQDILTLGDLYAFVLAKKAELEHGE